ncbi:MAG: SDR family oxidoreductase [Deltaproteobacteria bacterium]|jgi:peroxisomal 2,4-dienoyl-CoA reductase|nr:SDR family oxidoreductase [Deltaproteobacteria bacterium]MBW2500153.1 SDR family oxidoreductase [Deltaproteobacteria bacterium]
MSVFREDLLADRVAWVTGGATGIGREIARTLGRHGARVCIASRNAANLEEAARAFESEGIECLWMTCDVREPDQVEAVVQGILERFGRLDIVVNNAAGNFPALITGLSPNAFKAVVDIDLRGTFHVTKAAFEGALREHGGQIVNITAPFDGVGVALQAHCAAAKMGVDSLTRTSAVEFGPYGVRVNGIAPGAIADTEGLSRLGSGDAETDARCPLGRVGARVDIANAVLFLCSDAASFITGQVICVDGGSAVDMMQLNLPKQGATPATG